MKKDYEKKIDEAVQALHYVREDNVIEIYADYRDDANFLLETIYNNRNNADLEPLVQEQIHEAYFDTIYEYEDEILKKAGLDGTEFEEDAREYLEETYCIAPPYDHFLRDDIKVNIMLATDEERNRDYCGIHEQYLAMEEPENVWNADETLAEKTGLSWLLEQQGHTMAELQATLKDYDFFFYDDAGYYKNRAAAMEKVSLSEGLAEFNKTHNAFLTSVCQELENHSYSMGVMTVLAKMSIEDFIKMQQGNAEVTMPQNCDIGIFNPWNGSGSCLEIELEKPLVFSSDLIRDVQIEGVKPQWEYTVDDVYGLIGSCWKEPTTMKEIELAPLDELRACIEENGWSVYKDEEGWDIRQASPAGEDFGFFIRHGNDVEEAVMAIKEYARDFDVDEHVQLNMGGRGAPGVVELVEDAQEIQEMLKELAGEVLTWQAHYQARRVSLDDVIKTAAAQVAERETADGAIDRVR